MVEGERRSTMRTLAGGGAGGTAEVDSGERWAARQRLRHLDTGVGAEIVVCAQRGGGRGGYGAGWIRAACVVGWWEETAEREGRAIKATSRHTCAEV